VQRVGEREREQVDSKEDWMQKKERNQRRPGSRRKKTSRVEEEEAATSAATAAEDGVNSKQFAILTFGQTLQSAIGEANGKLLLTCRRAPGLGPTPFLILLEASCKLCT